jgi:hypothetical protein
LPLAAALALSACATPGNFTTYRVPCQLGDKGVRKVMTGVAQSISDALHKPVQVTDQPEQLMLRIDLSSGFWTGGTRIGFRWVSEGRTGYEISIDRNQVRQETSDIQLARETVEKITPQSACPVFNRGIEYSQPSKLG